MKLASDQELAVSTIPDLGLLIGILNAKLLVPAFGENIFGCFGTIYLTNFMCSAERECPSVLAILDISSLLSLFSILVRTVVRMLRQSKANCFFNRFYQ